MICHKEKIKNLKGFLDDEEAARIYEIALKASGLGHPCLEIGSYCGKSAICMGAACKKRGGVLFSVDHHKGSEEQQPGEEYFDPELFDPRHFSVNTLEYFRKTIKDFDLEDTIIPIVAESGVAGRMWATRLSLLFIDGGHSYETALADYSTWAGHIMPKGYLLVHDIFKDSASGGQAPRQIYQMALSSGLFTELPMTKTLGVLKRKTGA